MDLALQTVVQGLLTGATYALIGLGMAVIYNISGILNFTHGEFISLAMYVSLSLYAALRLDPYVSALVTFPGLFLAGVAFYWSLIRPILGKHPLMIVQITLGAMFIIQNLLLIGYGGHYQRVPSVVEGKLLTLGTVPVRTSMLVSFVISSLLAAGLYGLLRWTDFGRSVRAIHQNARAAALMGVDVERVRTVTFGIGVALLAVAGALLAPDTPIHPSQGLRYTVITLIVLVLGGMGNFAGVFVGGLITGIAEALGSVFISGTLGFLVPYLVFVLILLFRPQGLLGGGVGR